MEDLELTSVRIKLSLGALSPLRPGTDFLSHRWPISSSRMMMVRQHQAKISTWNFSIFKDTILAKEEIPSWDFSNQASKKGDEP